MCRPASHISASGPSWLLLGHVGEGRWFGCSCTAGALQGCFGQRKPSIKLAPSLPHMIRSCSWLGNQVNCSDIFTQVVTDSGVCCAFNVQDNLKESEYSRLVREMRKTESGDNGQVRKVTSGVGRGLEVILDQNSHRSNQSNCNR